MRWTNVLMLDRSALAPLRPDQPVPIWRPFEFGRKRVVIVPTHGEIQEAFPVAIVRPADGRALQSGERIQLGQRPPRNAVRSGCVAQQRGASIPHPGVDRRRDQAHAGGGLDPLRGHVRSKRGQVTDLRQPGFRVDHQPGAQQTRDMRVQNAGEEAKELKACVFGRNVLSGVVAAEKRATSSASAASR